MQFLSSLFGGSDVLTAVFALLTVLVLIVAAVWVLKFVFRASDVVGRGRNRRLTLVDSMTLDPKRQLHIIRRDDVEHLILTGGPQDVILESSVPVEKAPVRRPVPTIVPHHAIRPDNPFAAEPEGEAARPERSAVERLRDFTKPLSQRASRSLRHTGLMRSVSMDGVPSPGNKADNPDKPPADSARTGTDETVGRKAGAEHQDKRDGIKAAGS